MYGMSFDYQKFKYVRKFMYTKTVVIVFVVFSVYCIDLTLQGKTYCKKKQAIYRRVVTSQTLFVHIMY